MATLTLEGIKDIVENRRDGTRASEVKDFLTANGFKVAQVVGGSQKWINPRMSTAEAIVPVDNNRLLTPAYLQSIITVITMLDETKNGHKATLLTVPDQPVVLIAVKEQDPYFKTYGGL